MAVSWFDFSRVDVMILLIAAPPITENGESKNHEKNFESAKRVTTLLRGITPAVGADAQAIAALELEALADFDVDSASWRMRRAVASFALERDRGEMRTVGISFGKDARAPVLDPTKLWLIFWQMPRPQGGQFSPST